MGNPTRSQILASSSIWVAVLLNIIPGVGTGYLYQRRWKAYWFTGLSSFGALILTMTLQSSIDPNDPAPASVDQFSLIILFAITAFTSIEASLAVKHARKSISNVPSM